MKFRGRLEHQKKDDRDQPKAVALKYDMLEDDAPSVIAAGEGRLAKEIIALAQESGIYIREDPLLAAALARVDVGEEIPPELYLLVAEVLAYVYRIEERYSEQRMQGF
jgi:flagellar biosynthesis protein